MNSGILKKAVISCVLILSFLNHAYPVDEYRSFTSYQEAVNFYIENFKTYDYMAPDSTAISSAVYFYTSKRQVFFIAFTSAPDTYYIFEGLSSNMWSAFKNAESKGKFYNKYIRGKYGFRL